METVKILQNPDINKVINLLAKSDLPTADITPGMMENFFAYISNDQVLAIVGLEIYNDAALLRSLAVEPSYRGTGIGKLMTDHAETEAKAKKVKSIYLLTTTAQKFFERNGYKCIGRENAPESIKATREFASICPASSAFMVKYLST